MGGEGELPVRKFQMSCHHGGIGSIHLANFRGISGDSRQTRPSFNEKQGLQNAPCLICSAFF
jgi:hypothetical protein